MDESDSTEISYDSESDSSSLWTSYAETESEYESDDAEIIESQLELIQEQISQTDSEKEAARLDDTLVNLENCDLEFEKYEEYKDDEHYEAQKMIFSEKEEVENWAESEEQIENNFEIRSRTSSPRMRTASQDSLNSNPKPWVDFEEENRSWRPVRFGEKKNEIYQSTQQKITKVNPGPAHFESSEGYKSDELKLAKKENRKKIMRKSSMKRTNSVQSLSSEASSQDQILPLQIKDIIQIHVEPEEKMRIQRNIERIRRLGYQTEPEPKTQFSAAVKRNPEKKIQFYSDGDATDVTTKPSTRSVLHFRRIPDRVRPGESSRDSMTRKFEKNQKCAINSLENVYHRHGQRTSQLLMDLTIQMTNNGYGQYRPKINQLN